MSANVSAPSLIQLEEDREFVVAGSSLKSATTLAAVVGDIAHSLARQAVTGLIIVNAHGGKRGAH